MIDKETLESKGVSLSTLLTHISTLAIPILQYRNKSGSISQKRADLLEIRKAYHGKIIINDSIELIDYADGLHLGQEDLLHYGGDKEQAVSLVREQIGDKLLGLSTHTLLEVEEANSLSLDYIGLGAYRSTQTKSDASVGGDELLEVAKSSKHPVALIGGIRLDDVFGDEITYRVVGSGLFDGL